MIFGLQFKSDTGETAEIVIDTESMQLKFRATEGGEWRDWKRADVDRTPDGTLNEVVFETASAKKAEVANKWTNPVTVMFTGGAVGSVTLDGSEEKLSVNLDTSGPIEAAVNSAMDIHLKRYHRDDYY